MSIKIVSQIAQYWTNSGAQTNALCKFYAKFNHIHMHKVCETCKQNAIIIYLYAKNKIYNNCRGQTLKLTFGNILARIFRAHICTSEYYVHLFFSIHTCFNSCSISLALISNGPRTAYVITCNQAIRASRRNYF